jgi:hypothetical protein
VRRPRARRRTARRRRRGDAIVPRMILREISSVRRMRGMSGLLFVLALGAVAGCHQKPGTLPVDSPMNQYQPPDEDAFKDDSDEPDADSDSTPPAPPADGKE